MSNEIFVKATYVVYYCAATTKSYIPVRYDEGLKVITVRAMRHLEKIYYLHTHCTLHDFVYYIVTASSKYLITSNSIAKKKNLFWCICRGLKHLYTTIMIQIMYFFKLVRFQWKVLLASLSRVKSIYSFTISEMIKSVQFILFKHVMFSSLK